MAILEECEATAWYEAQGLLETKQETFLTVDSITTVTSEILETQSIISQVQSVSTTAGEWYDPVAETFLTGDNDLYISSIDLFFRSKDENAPITVQIRNTVNGYPGQIVLQTKTNNPSEVYISEDASIPTPFYFRDPVMLNARTEYCFVVWTNSTNYNIWCSKMGEFDTLTGKRVVTQPYMGVLFMSQNGSTWTTDQNMDIKFTFRKANFEREGTLVFTAVSGVQAGLLAFNTTQALPAGTKIDWFYSTAASGDNWIGFVPLRNTPLNQIRDTVRLKAVVTGSGISPMISRDRNALILVKFISPGYYVSLPVEMDVPFDGLKMYVERDTASSSGTDLQPYYCIDDPIADVHNWIPMTPKGTPAQVRGTSWYEWFYENDVSRITHENIGIISNFPRRKTIYEVHTDPANTMIVEIQTTPTGGWTALTVERVPDESYFTTLPPLTVQFCDSTSNFHFSESDLATYTQPYNYVRVTYSLKYNPTQYRILFIASTTNMAVSPKFRRIRTLAINSGI